jgi:DNA-binding HxlR family transcriptional regulator
MSKTINPSLRRDRVLFDLIGDKWTLLVLGALCDNDGRLRFNELRCSIPEISQKSLTTCLRRLERNGLVQRRVIVRSPLGMEYSFTELGDTLDAPVTGLLAWTARYSELVRVAQDSFDSSES